MCINSENDAASRDATMAFRERRKLKGKKLYSEYAVKETMVVSYKDEDNMEQWRDWGMRLPSPTTFVGMVGMKPKMLTVEEANEQKPKEEEKHIHLQNTMAKQPLM
jgi:hypothetical protein